MSVVGAVLVPAAPVLVPGLSGNAVPAPEARTAALGVIKRLIQAGPDEVVVLAEADREGSFDGSAPWDLHRLGGMPAVGDPGAGGSYDQRLPVSLAIGASMLRDAGWTGSTSFQGLERTMSSDAATEVGRHLGATPRSVGLLLLGNGSACCTAKAPGSLHPRASAFNEALLAMIQQGNLAAMMELSADETADQLSDIRVPLQVFAGATSPRQFLGSIAFAEEFAGVQYICATLLPDEDEAHPVGLASG
ncbi:MAG: hypothetical protein ACOYO9_06040 [Candidatus Nanopelagicales bacterium]